MALQPSKTKYVIFEMFRFLQKWGGMPVSIQRHLSPVDKERACPIQQDHMTTFTEIVQFQQKPCHSEQNTSIIPNGAFVQNRRHALLFVPNSCPM